MGARREVRPCSTSRQWLLVPIIFQVGPAPLLPAPVSTEPFAEVRIARPSSTSAVLLSQSSTSSEQSPPTDDLLALVRRGSMGSLAIKVANVALGLGVAVVLARVLGAEGYGIYSWAFALVALAAIPARMGLSQLLMREIAAYQLKEEWGLLRGILVRANQAVLGSSLGLAGVAAAALWWFSPRLDPAEVGAILWGLLLLPLMALGDLRGAALRGLRRVVIGQLPEKVLRPLGLILLVGGAALYVEVSASDAMALHAAAATASFLVGAVLLLRNLPDQVGVAEPQFESRRWLSSVMPLSLIAGMQVINSQADIVLLGIFAPSEEVGYYRIAVKGATLVAFTLSAVNMVVAPYIARLHAEGRTEKLQEMLTLTARVIILTALPVAAGLAAAGEPILGFVFGDEYRAGYSPLVILTLAQLVNAAAGSVGVLLNMTGHERDSAFGASVAAVLNVALNLALIPRYGMEGAAVATIATYITWQLILCRRAYRRLGMVTTAVRWGR